MFIYKYLYYLRIYKYIRIERSEGVELIKAFYNETVRFIDMISDLIHINKEI